jgi:mono/diheme cytochrome c family protein
MTTPTFLIGLTAAVLMSGFTPAQAADNKWVAPASAKGKTNPLPKDAANIAAGQKIFTANCVPCHGPAGKGDGPAAAALNPKPANFSDPKVRGQTDGELFWKMSEGHGAMVAWKTALSETQRWQLVEYVRSLAK